MNDHITITIPRDDAVMLCNLIYRIKQTQAVDTLLNELNRAIDEAKALEVKK